MFLGTPNLGQHTPTVSPDVPADGAIKVRDPDRPVRSVPGDDPASAERVDLQVARLAVEGWLPPLPTEPERDPVKVFEVVCLARFDSLM